MYCGSCGSPNPDRATFCSRCGQRIRAAATPQSGEVAPPGPPPVPPAAQPPAAQPPSAQIPAAQPMPTSGSSWIDPGASAKKASDSWIQPAAPPPPANLPVAQIPNVPPQIATPIAPPPPFVAPPPPAQAQPPRTPGASWIDPGPQMPRSGDSWIQVSQPPVPQPSQIPQDQYPPVQNCGQPAQPVYNPPYAQPPYGQAYQAPGAATQFPQPELKGVGGWLLFFVVCLTILGPLASLFVVVFMLIGAGSLANTHSELLGFAVINALLIIPYSVWGLMVGTGLWKARAGAARHAKQYLLWGSIPFAIIINLLPLGLPPADQTDQANASAAIGIIVGVGVALIWRSYLTKSRRVANTFPQG